MTVAHHEPAPYAEATDPAYAERAAETFTLREAGPGLLVLSGPCPRCAAPLEVPLPHMVFRGLDGILALFRPSQRRPASDTRDEPVACACDEHHPDRPEGRKGCGAYWVLRISGCDA
ncbi:hypothetical protein QA802_05340 [Streptomyces sp. B21-105]|uniref:hypothetical protein n=1 Tax=Streptomyces sp. B21-105 TaxID=3039417 RepID=UPI002FF1AD48